MNTQLDKESRRTSRVACDVVYDAVVTRSTYYTDKHGIRWQYKYKKTVTKPVKISVRSIVKLIKDNVSEDKDTRKAQLLKIRDAILEIFPEHEGGIVPPPSPEIETGTPTEDIVTKTPL